METKHSIAMVMLKKRHGTPTALGAIDIGLDASQTASPLRGAGEDFYLDIPSHRIPWQVGLHQSLPPLCQPGTVSCNIVLLVDGFSSTRRFQNLGQKRVQFSVTFLNEATRPVLLIVARHCSVPPTEDTQRVTRTTTSLMTQDSIGSKLSTTSPLCGVTAN